MGQPDSIDGCITFQKNNFIQSSILKLSIMNLSKISMLALLLLQINMDAFAQVLKEKGLETLDLKVTPHRILLDEKNGNYIGVYSILNDKDEPIENGTINRKGETRILNRFDNPASLFNDKLLILHQIAPEDERDYKDLNPLSFTYLNQYDKDWNLLNELKSKDYFAATPIRGGGFVTDDLWEFYGSTIEVYSADFTKIASFQPFKNGYDSYFIDSDDSLLVLTLVPNSKKDSTILMVISSETGEIKCKANICSSKENFYRMNFEGGIIFLNSPNRFLAIDKRGNVLWDIQVSISDIVFSKDKNLIFYYDYVKGTLNCIHPYTGSLIWSKEISNDFGTINNRKPIPTNFCLIDAAECMVFFRRYMTEPPQLLVYDLDGVLLQKIDYDEKFSLASFFFNEIKSEILVTNFTNSVYYEID